MADSNSKCELISRKEAKAEGRKFYYTGRACKRGHICLRLVSSEMCWECSLQGTRRWHRENREKALRGMRVRYHTNKAYHLDYAKKYYVANAERLRNKSRKYRAEKPDLVKEINRRCYYKHWKKCRAANKKWIENNRDHRRKYRREKLKDYDRAYNKLWKLLHPDRSKLASRKTYRKHRESRLERQRAYFLKNPEVKRASQQRHRARKRGAEGSYSGKNIKAIFLAQHERCAYCKHILGKKYQVDHIVPLSKGGTNYPANLQLLCAPCNRSKSDRDAIEYAQSLGLLL